MRVDLIDLPGPLYLRLAEQDGRWSVIDVYIDGRGARITPLMLRTLPLADIEDVCNSADVVSNLAARAATAAVRLTDAASYYATTVGSQNRTWIAGMLRGEPVRRKPNPGDAVHLEAEPLHPPERGLTPTFLAELGRAYATAKQRGEAPAVALAAQSGANVRTVHRWIYLARKAGAIPPSGRRRAAATTQEG